MSCSSSRTLTGASKHKMNMWLSRCSSQCFPWKGLDQCTLKTTQPLLVVKLSQPLTQTLPLNVWLNTASIFQTLETTSLSTIWPSTWKQLVLIRNLVPWRTISAIVTYQPWPNAITVCVKSQKISLLRREGKSTVTRKSKIQMRACFLSLMKSSWPINKLALRREVKEHINLLYPVKNHKRGSRVRR